MRRCATPSTGSALKAPTAFLSFAAGHPRELAAGRDVRLAAAAVASWARYADGVDEQGEPIEVVDGLADQLKAIAAKQRTDPTAFIANRELFGGVIDERAFVEPYVAALDSLHTRGARATLEALRAEGASRNTYKEQMQTRSHPVK